MAQHTLPAVLLLLCTAQLVNGYPSLYIYHLNSPCMAHPDRGYRGHLPPLNDPNITFTVTDGSGKAGTTVCPGANYTVQVGFGGERRLMLVTTESANLTGSEPDCPGRVAVDRSLQVPLGGYGPQPTQKVTMAVNCNANKTLALRVTSASGSKAHYMQSSATLTVDPACAAAACAAKAKPAAKGKAAAPAPGAKPVSPAPAKASAKPAVAPAAPAKKP